MHERSRTLWTSSAHLLAVAQRQGGLGFWSGDLAANEIYGTDGFYRSLGLGVRSLLSFSEWQSVVYASDLDIFLSMFALLRDGQSVCRDFRIVHPDYSVHWIRVDTDAIVGPDGQLRRVVGVLLNIDRERELLLATERENDRFRMLVKLSGDYVWTTDINGAIVELQAWQALTGQLPDTGSHTGWANMVHPDDRIRVMSEWRASFDNGRPYNVRYRLQHPDGNYRWVTVTGAPIFSESGTMREWIGLIRHDAPIIPPNAAEKRGWTFTSAQMRGARAMLNWSVETLSAAAGVSVATILRFESDKTSLRDSTKLQLYNALEQAGIQFGSDGSSIGLRTI
ncbi:PAS domain-containing protein [Bradyrhizobium sp. 2TAF24]|uniref:PAS domain-containing protein n=1 Tax=Bradyrhizobium sp. 2TAF24 TaxID=3233011 RepID=UPI003F931683